MIADFQIFLKMIMCVHIIYLCNGGSLYAPYSLLSISNMLCDASFLPWGGGEQGGKVTLRPCFQGHNVLYGF
jgi:hypothetical protein